MRQAPHAASARSSFRSCAGPLQAQSQEGVQGARHRRIRVQGDAEWDARLADTHTRSPEYQNSLPCCSHRWQWLIAACWYSSVRCEA
eukprot:5156034-Pleurochrysis_carterae.AAC.6